MKKLIFIALLPLMLAACEPGGNDVKTRYIPCKSEDMQQVGTKSISGMREYMEFVYTDGILKLTHGLIVNCSTIGCGINCTVETGDRIEISERPAHSGQVDTGCLCMSQVIVELAVPKQKYEVEIHVYDFDSGSGQDILLTTQRYTVDLNAATSGTVYVENNEPVLTESDAVDSQLVGTWECVLKDGPYPDSPYFPGDEEFTDRTLVFDSSWKFTETTDKGTHDGDYAIGSYSYEDPNTQDMVDGGRYLQFKYTSGDSDISIYEITADTLWTYPEPLTAGGASYKYVRK